MRRNDEEAARQIGHCTAQEMLECLTCKHTESTGTMTANTHTDAQTHTHTHQKNNMDFLYLPQHTISLPRNQVNLEYVIGLVGQLKHPIPFSAVGYTIIHKEVSTHIKINLDTPPKGTQSTQSTQTQTYRGVH